MCLDRVLDEDLPQSVKGWKVFCSVPAYGFPSGKENVLYSLFYVGAFPLSGEWIVDETEGGGINTLVTNKVYPRGFHFYAERQDAEKTREQFGDYPMVIPAESYVVRMVEAEDIVAVGVNNFGIDSGPTYVARKLRILNDDGSPIS